MSAEPCVPEWLAREDAVREKTDAKGDRWRKVYFGGGSHFANWLEQFKEVYGSENIEVEEMEPEGLACYERAGEKMYRIWARVPE